MPLDKRESEAHDTGACKQQFGNWGAYATAAGAALAMSTNASASIISSTVNIIATATPTNDLVHFSAAGGAATLVDELFYFPHGSRSGRYTRARLNTAVILQRGTSLQRFRFGVTR